MPFLQAQHEVYKHWGNERIAAWFAIDVEVLEGLGTSKRKTVNYPNCGHPVEVIFENGWVTPTLPQPRLSWRCLPGERGHAYKLLETNTLVTLSVEYR